MIMIAAIVLAAGTSSRMGEAKQLLNFNGSPILRLIIEIICQTKIEPIIVVLGHEKSNIQTVLNDLPVIIVHNPDYTKGQSTSVQAGLTFFMDILNEKYPRDPNTLVKTNNGALFVLGDQPMIKPDTINILIETYAIKGGIVAPTYKGKRGNPVIFDQRFFPQFFSLQGDTGGREIINRNSSA